MAKDKIIGLVLLIVGIAILYVYGWLIGYVVYYLFAPGTMPDVIPIWPLNAPVVYLVAGPTALFMILLAVILAWIGFTMVRTPPPVPLEGFETVEEEAAAEEKKEEEKKE